MGSKIDMIRYSDARGDKSQGNGNGTVFHDVSSKIFYVHL